MTVAQVNWVLANMVEDRQETDKALKRVKKQKSKVYSALGEE